MVTSHHDRTDFTFADQFIELEGNIDTADFILIEDTGLGTNDHLVLFSVADPDVVIAILIATVRIDELMAAISVLCRSSGLPLRQTQRNGP